jgi:hypothetical protein
MRPTAAPLSSVPFFPAAYHHRQADASKKSPGRIRLEATRPATKNSGMAVKDW